jgi:4-hydroxythreonine-4-phosphate dehydrogenase
LARPPLVLSLGEPAGVGPEVVPKAWTELRHGTPFFVVGDAGLLAAEGVPVRKIGHPDEAAAAFAGSLPVLHHPVPVPVTAGTPDVRNAGVVADWIEQSVALCLGGEASGLVTARLPARGWSEQRGLPLRLAVARVGEDQPGAEAKGVMGGLERVT